MKLLNDQENSYPCLLAKQIRDRYQLIEPKLNNEVTKNLDRLIEKITPDKEANRVKSQSCLLPSEHKQQKQKEAYSSV